MTRHKAPTAVTIAPIQERSGFGLWVEKYWKVGLVLVVLIAAWILIQTRSKQAIRSAGESDWSKVLSAAQEDPRSGSLRGSVNDLRRIGADLKGSQAGGWALYIAATSAIAEDNLESAKTALDELRRLYPDHMLLTHTFPSGDAAPARSMVQVLEDRIDAHRAFLSEHSSLFANPPVPADAPRVKLDTERGPIVIGLYPNLAPTHVENFLKLVRNGYYIGTKFHFVSQGEFVQGGDPNSARDDPTIWGKGGPGYSLEPERSVLKHFQGVISAVPDPTDPAKTSGSQFILTTASLSRFDESHVPFGQILEGFDVLRGIEAAPLDENTFDRPKDPASITAIEVLP